MPPTSDRLRQITSFPQLVKYLRDDLDWPIEREDFEDLTFDWDARELGIDTKAAAKIEEIKQLRPLADGQPWGIFFVKFEPKRLPIVVLRRLLSQLAVREKPAAARAHRQAWKVHDLLFISAHGESGDRRLTFAHFAQEHQRDLPTLRVLGWDGDDTTLALEYAARTLRDKLAWPEDTDDLGAWSERWASAFELRPHEVIRTSKELAIRLADLAKGIRDRAEQILELEIEGGRLRKLHEAFRAVLVHNLSESDFADMYAQTITYGLFSAAVTGEGLGDRRVLVAEDLATAVPLTNPFLRELLGSFLHAGGRQGLVDFDELGVQEVVKLLRHPDTHLGAILRDFGHGQREEDPVIHFYESFLREYDATQKVKRGVFYTPQPVVSYIVRGVDELLRTEFGLEDGLASTVTWGAMAERHVGLTVPNGTSPGSPFVTILDPATGTATFLVEVIDLIHQTMQERWRRERVPEREWTARWNAYVPEHLLPRMFGYELMMAPYAIAHMKVGLKLLETGYDFRRDVRARIYLTNALEPGVDLSGTFAFAAPALAHEAQAVSDVKRTQHFTVVLGNPPYSNFGQLNRNPYILGLLGDYKVGLKEKKLNLDDDFIKFFRLFHEQIQRSGHGVIGLITNHTYINGITHRRMRESLLGTFGVMHVMDLHGSQIIPETPPPDTEDRNVFAIKQGVAIALAASVGSKERVVEYADLWGSRKAKYDFLATARLGSVKWQRTTPRPPYYFLVPSAGTPNAEYEGFVSLREVMPVGSSAVQTKRDELFVDLDRARLVKRMREVLRGLTETTSAKYPLEESSGWSPSRLEGVKFSEGCVRPYYFRPFDQRWVYYDDALLGRSRWKVFRHLLRPNLALATLRQTVDDGFRHVLCVGGLCDINLLINHHVSDQVFPLYLYQAEADLLVDTDARHANLSPAFVDRVARACGLQWCGAGPGDLLRTFGPEDLLGYIYGVLHSAGYRRRYWEKLKVDFPRIPVPATGQLFRKLAALGRDLVEVHTAAGAPSSAGARWKGSMPSQPVGKVTYTGETIWIDGKQREGLTHVSSAVWDFQVGGYAVCSKWLGGRKGMSLGRAEIDAFGDVVRKIEETLRLMALVEKEIERGGGWPNAFASA